jgi:hypothetical protein
MYLVVFNVVPKRPVAASSFFSLKSEADFGLCSVHDLNSKVI